MKMISCFIILLLLTIPTQGNLIKNWDFESGTIEPWTCHNCKASISQPGYESDRGLLVSRREDSKAGPQQKISIDSLSPNGKYDFGCRILADAPLQLNWRLKVKSKDGSTTSHLLTRYQLFEPVDKWQYEGTVVNFPNKALQAEEVYITLDGDSHNVEFRIDKVHLNPRHDPENWEEEANQRIEKIRKSNANITIVGDLERKFGNNLILKIEQLGHNFAFGTAVDCELISKCLEEGKDDDFCTFAYKNYNMVVCHNHMKIQYVEHNQGEYRYDIGDSLIEWARLHGLRTRAHCLFWAKEENNPTWMQNLYGDEFIDAVFDRVDNAVARYNGYVEHWDVINEMIDQGDVSHKFYIEHSGDEMIRTKIFNRTKKISPQTKLFLNDYSIVDDNYGRFHLYQVQIRDFLKKGTPIDGIGLQSHFNGKLIDIFEANDNVNRLWNEFKIPLWITEFTWSSENIEDPLHDIHAEQLQNYYRMMFSNEGIDGLVMWHFAHGKGWDIVDPNTLEPNSAGDAYLKLYHEEWRTNESLKNIGAQNENEVARFSFRGFKGDYSFKLMDANTEIGHWQMNLDENTEWMLSID